MKNLSRRERERLAHEEEVIEAAERVFGEKGFDGALMDEIALDAQFTKRTVYLYFGTKEELFFAAALSGFKKFFSFLQKASENAQPGFEKLRQGCRGYYRFYKEHPNTMRLIGEIGYVKKRAGEGSQRLNELMNFDNEMFKWVAQVINEGKRDGSIRRDIDAMKTTFSIIFMMTGFFNQLTMTGTTFMAHFSLDPEDFSNYSMDLLLNSICNDKN